jgi:hypothetical protein
MCEDFPVPQLLDTSSVDNKIESDIKGNEVTSSTDGKSISYWSTLFEPSCPLTEPHLSSREGLSYLICDLSLSKYQSESLDSRFKVWNLPKEALLHLCSISVKNNF